MRYIFRFVSTVIILINLYFCAYYVLAGDILFQTDIARDFLLLNETTQKLTLIGPRSSTTGLFHGPLWLYLNLPAFILGHGNPIAVGWFWIALITAFLLGSFVMVKKLFNEETAFFYTMLLSLFLVFQAKGLFNPHGALFVLPFFFYFFIRYLQTKKVMFLLIHLFLVGMLIQFEMAIGIPFLLLSTLAISVFIIRERKWKHILSFFILIIPLSTFLLFDIRHDFLQLRAVGGYLTSKNSSDSKYNSPLKLMGDRLTIATSGGIQLFVEDNGINNKIGFLILAGSIILLLIQKKNRLFYVSFTYFYFGYFFLSLINKGILLAHYIYPLFPLTLLVFVSFFTTKYKYFFLAAFLFVYIVNAQLARTYIESASSYIGKSQESWKFLDSMAHTFVSLAENNSGYFVYTPDVVAYQPKYALLYETKQSKKTLDYFQKKSVTYIIAAPPPPDNPYMKDEWWRENQLHLKKNPQTTITFINNYKIETYSLTSEEISVPFDPGIDPGLHFR